MSDPSKVWCPLCLDFHEHAPDLKAQVAELQSRLHSCELDLSTARQSLYEVVEQRNNAMRDAFQKGCRLNSMLNWFADNDVHLALAGFKGYRDFDYQCTKELSPPRDGGLVPFVAVVDPKMPPDEIRIIAGPNPDPAPVEVTGDWYIRSDDPKAGEPLGVKVIGGELSQPLSDFTEEPSVEWCRIDLPSE